MDKNRINSSEELLQGNFKHSFNFLFNLMAKHIIETGIFDAEHGLKPLLLMLKAHGKHIKQLNWDYDLKVSQEDFIKVLNLMPNLTNLKLRSIELEAEKIEENPKKKQKLDLEICKNLKIVDCNDESVLNFFALNFNRDFIENSASKLLLSFYANYDKLVSIESTEAELIQRLEVVEDEEEVEEFSNFSKFSNLEELKITTMCFEDDFIEEISTLKNLKKLKFLSCELNYSELNWKSLGYLENLEILSFKDSELDLSFLGDLKLKSLRKLSLKGEDLEGLEFIFENLSINSLNLKVLKVHNSPHKINFYAKLFKNLERLHLKFFPEYASNSIELDTGIVNENLKEIKIKYYGVKDEVNDLLEIVEIFPNLESIKAKWHEVEKDVPILANKFLFAKLNKLKHLKVLKFNNKIKTNRCSDFLINGELIDDLKSLSKKLKFYDIQLEDACDEIGDEFVLFANCLKEILEVKYASCYICSLKNYR